MRTLFLSALMIFETNNMCPTTRTTCVQWRWSRAWLQPSHTISEVWYFRSSAHQYHTEALLGRILAAFARTAPYDEDDEETWFVE